jgi:hypothetical protein
MWQYEMLDAETAALTQMTTESQTELTDELTFLWNCDPNKANFADVNAYTLHLKASAGFIGYVANPAIPLETQRTMIQGFCTPDTVKQGNYDNAAMNLQTYLRFAQYVDNKINNDICPAK